MSDSKNGSYLHGAAILAASVVIVKIIGGIYKIPLYNMLGTEGTAYYIVAYNIYSLLLTISTAGLPVALSKMVSSARALERPNQVRKVFSISRVVFLIVGLIGSVIMFAFPREIAELIGGHGNDGSWYSIRALSPALVFICITSAYRGYFQGHSDMIPTSTSQMIEALCKLVFGLSLAWWLISKGNGYPIVAAGAIMGVSIGTMLSIMYMLYYKHETSRKYKTTSAATDTPDSNGRIIKNLLNIGIPITISASFLSLINLLDTGIILDRLQSALGMTYDAANELLGSYSMVLTLYNLPSSIIIPVTVSFMPAITAYLAKRQYSDAAAVTESGLKITNLIAMPAGAGLTALAAGIVAVLYPSAGVEASGILSCMGIASIASCGMLMTNAILQAYGYERFTVYSAVIGGIIKVALNWILLSIESIGIYGAAIASVICYFIIVILNLSIIMVKVPQTPNLAKAYVKPILCTAVMGIGAYASFSLLHRLLSGVIYSGILRFSADWLTSALALLGAMIIAVIIYLILIIASGALTYGDMRMLPKGEKMAKKLKIK